MLTSIKSLAGCYWWALGLWFLSNPTWSATVHMQYVNRWTNVVGVGHDLKINHLPHYCVHISERDRYRRGECLFNLSATTEAETHGCCAETSRPWTIDRSSGGRAWLFKHAVGVGLVSPKEQQSGTVLEASEKYVNNMF